jgi:hypothetical protein
MTKNRFRMDHQTLSLRGVWAAGSWPPIRRSNLAFLRRHKNQIASSLRSPGLAPRSRGGARNDRAFPLIQNYFFVFLILTMGLRNHSLKKKNDEKAFWYCRTCIVIARNPGACPELRRSEGKPGRRSNLSTLYLQDESSKGCVNPSFSENQIASSLRSSQ